MRILLADKTFPGEPDIELALVGDAGTYEHYRVAEEVPEASWRAAEAVQTFRASPFVNAMADKLDNCRISTLR